MKYSPLVSTPGSLMPKNANVMRNPGLKRNYDFADNCLLREATMVKDLIAYFLNSPSTDKADEYWTYFKSQWKQNIINYIKNTNGTTSVTEKEINHYKKHYKHRTALRLVSEYVERSKELDRIKIRYPHIPPDQNKLLFGNQRNLQEIHSRLMPYYKNMKDLTIDRDMSVKR